MGKYLSSNIYFAGDGIYYIIYIYPNIIYVSIILAPTVCFRHLKVLILKSKMLNCMKSSNVGIQILLTLT